MCNLVLRKIRFSVNFSIFDIFLFTRQVHRLSNVRNAYIIFIKKHSMGN